MQGLKRQLIYLAVLRPSFFFALIIVYLPVTAAADWVPGNSMLANLLVEYDFWKAFCFAFALSGTVWALMLTTCLTLDFARDRQVDESGRHRWVPDPGPKNRWVSVPVQRKSVFWGFTLLGAPAVFIVILRATNESLLSWRGSSARLYPAAGLLVGWLLSYVLMHVVAAFVRAENHAYEVLPWRPGAFISAYLRRFRLSRRAVDWLAERLRRIAGFARWLLSKIFAWFAPPRVFEISPQGTRTLKSDHFFAAVSAVSVLIVYAGIYWFFKPSGAVDLFLDRVLPASVRWVRALDSLPPAGFIYALLFPLIWIVAALWAWLGHYRLALYLALGTSLALTLLATRLGRPVHTYDVAAMEVPNSLAPQAILTAPGDRPHRNVIIVAASGGGILAAGWTAQVLTKLHAAYPEFGRELRLISSVSGGSVGAAHYVNSVSDISRLEGVQDREAALRDVAEDAMRSSLAASAYGVAFPDFKRAIFPFVVDEEFDRARLLEADWRRIGNCRRQAPRPMTGQLDFREFCRTVSQEDRKKPVWFSEWRKQIEEGDKPAVIFNATVMETGQRIAITPLATLQSGWAGSLTEPPRHDQAYTLSEFLSGGAQSALEADPSQKAAAPAANKKEDARGACAAPEYQNGYDIDVWTAARLSATFSYVSPAARAACVDYRKKARTSAAADTPGRLHLIDGGYHDNYGVASALDWLSAAIKAYGHSPLPVSRIALVEIRAQPDIPGQAAQNEWSSAWLGPFWGLLNSWGYAQMSSNDGSVNRLIARFKADLERSKKGVEFESFVFVRKDPGPLSWHLSEDQKNELRKSWDLGTNPAILEKLLEFLRR
jgi:hypothetical protein